MNRDVEHRSEQRRIEKPRWDSWHVRLPDPKDQQCAVELFRKSRAETKSDFIRARILGGDFRVTIVDKSTVEYYRKFSGLTAQIYRIGVLYNQAVRTINSYHSVRTTHILFEKLEKLSVRIIEPQRKAAALVTDYRSK